MKKKEYNSEQLKSMIEEVRACTIFFCTENGKVCCSSAEKYLIWINEYSKYCMPEMKMAWEENVRKIIYSPWIPKPQHLSDPNVKELIEINNYVIIDSLYNFMDAGRVMQIYSDTKSWEAVDEVVKEQGHSGFTFSGLLNIMIQYSLIGVDFVDRYDPDRPKRDKEFKKVYNKAKSYTRIRKDLNKRLVYSLSKKIY